MGERGGFEEGLVGKVSNVEATLLFSARKYCSHVARSANSAFELSLSGRAIYLFFLNFILLSKKNNCLWRCTYGAFFFAAVEFRLCTDRSVSKPALRGFFHSNS
ncbi:MAG: hypothetical protein OIF58_14315 [Cohaesibacter sp.]|nr:hypothetical protein [Cohaesibacter sp.]